MNKMRFGISGSTLKIIAIMTMLTDHVAAIILDRIMIVKGIRELGNQENSFLQFIQENPWLYYGDFIMRLIGRLGFPLFCFLLIEGFHYTKNKKKYAGRMLLFCFASEIPFDLAFRGKFFDMSYQNVFFTLLIGLLVLMGFQYLEHKKEGQGIFGIFLQTVVLVAGVAAAELLQADYGAFGVMTIVVMHMFRKKKMVSAGAGCAVLTVMNLTEITSFFSLIPIGLYNGKRGWNLKYLFYVFYPLHILLLYIIAVLAGLGSVQLVM